MAGVLLHGTACARRAAVQAKLGNTSDAEAHFTRSIAILKQLGQQFPDQGIIQTPLAQTRQQLGELLRTSATDDSLEQSHAVLNEAITDFETYLSKTPNSSHSNQQTRSKLYESLAETPRH